MKRIGMGLTVLGTLLAGATGALAWTPDAQLERELIRGDSWADVLPAADGAGLIHAAIDIAAPPRTVWAVMTDCKMAARLVSSVTSCRIMQGDQRSGWDIREQVTKANFFVPTIPSRRHPGKPAKPGYPGTRVPFSKRCGGARPVRPPVSAALVPG